MTDRTDLPNMENLNIDNNTDPPPEDSMKNEPKRFIYSEEDMEHFRSSPAKKTLLAFTTALGQSCIPSCKTPSSKDQYTYDPIFPLKGLNPGMASLHGSLRAIAELWLTNDYFPPDPSAKARFGNPMFRAWHDHLTQTGCSTDIANEILDCHLEYYDIYQTLSLSTSEEDIKMKADILDKCSARGYRAAIAIKLKQEDKSSKSTLSPSKESSKAIKRKEKNRNDPKRQHLLKNLLPYLHSSFGHPTRLDYGTGHESSFLIFLFVLYQMGPLAGNTNKSTSPSSPPMKLKFPLDEAQKQILAPVALSIFSLYLQVTRGLQTEYMLEPAGSHGVWGLDDYHCLPFYFGACQLMDVDGDDKGEKQDHCNPASIHDEQLLEAKAAEKMYFGCILYIRTLKKGVPFGESSPMLNDISYLRSWEKVAKGLLKLYEGEVLNKLPVVQHFVFGDFFPGEFYHVPISNTLLWNIILVYRE